MQRRQLQRAAGLALSIGVSICLASAVIPFLIRGAAAYDDGPPDGMAGDPPSSETCLLCHSDFPLNSGAGQLALLGVPQTFTPGQSYGLTIELDDPAQQRWGFELTVLDAANEAAGTLVVTDPVNTQLSDNPAPAADYLKQTWDGTYAGTAGPAHWDFTWVAPAAGDVTFYLAGNAADYNHAPTGDYIYAIQVAVGGAVPVEATSWGRIKGTFGGAR